MFSDAWEVRALLSGLAYIYYHMVCALYVTFLKAAGFFGESQIYCGIFINRCICPSVLLIQQ